MSLVDAATVARELGVSREYVYRHAARLGGVKLGDEPTDLLRFDLARVRQTLRPAPDPKTRSGSSTRPHPSPSRVPLLPVRGRRE